MNAELQFLRAIGRCVPPLPRATGVANRLLKPLYLRRQRSSVLAKAWGFQLRLDPREAIDGAILFCPHLYNRAEFQWLRTYLRSSDTFVDVGAHIGSFSLHASRLVSRVIAVEPNPKTFATLTENIRMNGRSIEAHNVGVSDKREVLSLHVQGDANAGGASFVVDHGRGDVSVQCVPLTEIASGADAIKLDVERMEHRVLLPYLETHRPRLIMLEHLAGPDAVGLCLETGYREVARSSENTLLQRV